MKTIYDSTLKPVRFDPHSANRSCTAVAHRLHALDATLAGARLAAAIGALVPLLAAEQDGVRLAAGRAIQCV